MHSVFAVVFAGVLVCSWSVESGAASGSAKVVIGHAAIIEKLKVEEMIDDRILRRLDESGFIEGLARNYGVR